MDRNNRMGESLINKFGSKMTISKYIDAKNIIVEFSNPKFSIKTTYRNFKILNVRYPYDKSVYGVGFIGIGDYDASIDRKASPQYDTWHSMLQRCYDEKLHKKRPSYIGCTVIEEWHNFQKFAKWYDDNIYEVFGCQRIELDKDILIKGNNVYSPETCVFVPQNINTLFIKRDSNRGEFPIGVYFKKKNDKYSAQCSNGKDKNQQYLGLFDTPMQAFNVYKSFKENIIKQIAMEYKDKIPYKLFNALYNYEVEYND